MIRNLTVSLACILLVVGIFVAIGDTAFAQEPPSSAGSSGDIAYSYNGGTPRYCSDFNDAEGALFGKIVPCLSNSIGLAARDMTRAMVDYFRPIFYAFLTLVIVLHGVTAAQGEGQIGPRTFLLLVKIAAVVAFVEALGGYMPELVNVADAYAIMHGTEDIMAGALLPSETHRGFSCNWGEYMPSNRDGHILWAEMDCALAKIMGFAAGSDGQPSMVLAASVLGMMTGFFFGGTFGIAVFFAAVGFLISLLSLVVRVGFAYMNAYMVVAMYVIISPIFIPLVLMRATTQYFQNWVKGLLGAMLTPVVVTAYSLFALLIFDKMLFQPNSMIQQLFNYSHIVDAQRSARTVSCGTIANDQVSRDKRTSASDPAYQQGGGALAADMRDPLMAAMTGVTKCEVQVTNLEVARAKLQGMTGDAALDEKRIFTQLMIDLAKMFILALIVTSGWKSVSQILLVLTGSSVGPMTIGAITPLERSISNSGSRAHAAMNQEMQADGKNGEEMGPGGAAGSAFVDRLLPTIAAGGKSFIEGVGR